MRSLLAIFALFLLPLLGNAQGTPLPETFTVSSSGNKFKFVPTLPPLVGIPGAPTPFYSYYWEFGDGSFSREANPEHVYAKPGEYETLLYATNNYDDGDPPPLRPKKLTNAMALVQGNHPLPTVFTESGQAIALKNIRQARANESLPVILSYANRSRVETGGTLHLFFNEKSFKTDHFFFESARTHFGEIQDPGFSSLEIPMETDWAALAQGLSETGASSPLFIPAPAPDGDRLLSEARSIYREERVWNFEGLQSGEMRNLFVTLAGTANMLRDTSSFIHFEGVFVPNVAGIPAEHFVVELEIVSSHDPNNITVSKSRTTFRRFGNKDLDYRVRFQNNGEGPASTIKVTVDIPKGLKSKSVKPKEWYPKCPICPEKPDPKMACLDTSIRKESLIFTFRNVYLPGSRQSGVTEYDSTKGFIKYNIVPDSKMSKKPFACQASIVFDKNAPVVTKKAATRFHTGVSPGLKIAYTFEPSALNDGYWMAGASFSPFKSWKWYPQFEALVGQSFSTTDVQTNVSTQVISADVCVLDSTILTSEIQRRPFELPILFRKSLTSWIGFGFGAGIKGNWDKSTTTGVQKKQNLLIGPNGVKTGGASVSTPLAVITDKTFTWTPVLLADLTIGAVRAGPNLGIRLQYPLKGEKKPVLQASLEFKF